MTVKNFSLPLFIIFCFFSCRKEKSNQQIIPIPNGDFELWDDIILYNWQTNPCTYCVPAFETYVVQKVTGASHGQYAAKFIYNGVNSSFAINKFPISQHPTLLTGYIKSNLSIGDTITLHVDLFYRNNIIDSGYFYETSSISNYKKIKVTISQSSSKVDSVFIKIVGGKKQGTELYVDNFEFLKSN